MKNKLKLFWHYEGEKVVMMCGVLVIVIMMFASILFITFDTATQKELKTTDQMLQVESGEWYNCDFYDNGDMECEQVGDPDVGGGRITP